MTDITALPDEWRNYRGDYSDDELTEYGKNRVEVYENLADLLQMALPKWTKIKANKNTWPALGTAGKFCSETGDGESCFEPYSSVWSEEDVEHIEEHYNTWWRPLCGLDYPPKDES